jgi:hypothetical protein
MAKRTGRRQAALERKALKHQDFVGSADAERAESEFYEHERIEQDRAHADGAIGPEFPFRLPRPGELREKARERLEKLPEPAQQALHVAGAAVQVMLVPMRIGWAFARELWRVPGQILRVFREA